MSEFCVINDAKSLLGCIRELKENHATLSWERREESLAYIVQELDEIIQSAEVEAQELQDQTDTAEDKLDEKERELEIAEEKITELEEERDALREQLLEITDWRGVLANDPDPYDLHGLHHGDDTGHSWYARFWQKLRSSFTH